MAWIESHQAVLGHPKTRRLCRSLQCKPVTAIGHLHALWWWALDYAQDGTLDGYEPADIADAALWEDDPEQFFEALVSSGYVDRDDNGTRLHDWWEYAGKLIQRRKDDVERKRKQAEKAGIPTGNGTSSNNFPAELQRNSHGSLQEVAEVPYVTNQPTNPYQPEDGAAAPVIIPPSDIDPRVYDVLDTLRQEHSANNVKYVRLKIVEHSQANPVTKALEAHEHVLANPKKYKFPLRVWGNWMKPAKWEQDQKPNIPTDIRPIFPTNAHPDVIHALQIVAAQLPTPEYNMYMGDVTTSQPDATTIFFQVPDKTKRQRWQSRYLPMFTLALHEIHSPLRAQLAS